MAVVRLRLCRIYSVDSVVNPGEAYTDYWASYENEMETLKRKSENFEKYKEQLLSLSASNSSSSSPPRGGNG